MRDQVPHASDNLLGPEPAVVLEAAVQHGRVVSRLGVGRSARHGVLGVGEDRGHEGLAHVVQRNLAENLLACDD